MPDLQVPSPTPETQPFWDGTAVGEIRLPRCLSCRRTHFYPRPICPHCHGRELEWITATGRGTLESYIVNRRPIPAIVEGETQIIAIVQLEEGPRLMTDIAGVLLEDAESLQLGSPVRAVYVERGGLRLPLFELITGWN